MYSGRAKINAILCRDYCWYNKEMIHQAHLMNQMIDNTEAPSRVIIEVDDLVPILVDLDNLSDEQLKFAPDMVVEDFCLSNTDKVIFEEIHRAHEECRLYGLEIRRQVWMHCLVTSAWLTWFGVDRLHNPIPVSTINGLIDYQLSSQGRNVKGNFEAFQAELQRQVELLTTFRDSHILAIAQSPH